MFMCYLYTTVAKSTDFAAIVLCSNLASPLTTWVNLKKKLLTPPLSLLIYKMGIILATFS